MSNAEAGLRAEIEQTFAQADAAVERYQTRLPIDEVGTVRAIGQGIALIEGLPGVRVEELLRFHGKLYGVALNLDPDSVGAILLDKSDDLEAGMSVQRTGRVLDVPVGEALLGRVVDALGRPLDGRGPIDAADRWAIEQDAPRIMSRAPVAEPLETGIKVLDALIPIGKGQRELLVGDRQTGKTTLAVDAILNQTGKDVICIYCAIGERSASVAKVVAELERYTALVHSIVIVSTGEDAPGLQYITPYTGTSMAEYFVRQGKDVLVVYDDLTRHARAYRELSLLLRRPPGREAFPGDIFYLHSRLLERAAHLHAREGGGSLTALPIVETQAQDISGYIPTNVISITDGQIYLSPTLFRKGILPAVDVGKSVSRVGGRAQLRAYRSVTGTLRLSYAQFEELETFARFGTRLEDETRRQLERGYRVREVLKQPRSSPISVAEQIAVFMALNEGLLDGVAVDDIVSAEQGIRAAVTRQLPDVATRISAGHELTEEDHHALLETARTAVVPFHAKRKKSSNGNE